MTNSKRIGSIHSSSSTVIVPAALSGSRRPGLAALAATLLVIGAGCVPAGSGSSTPPPASGGTSSTPILACQKAMEKVLVPVEIKGHKHLYFDLADLNWLMANYRIIETFSFDVTVQGKHDGSPTDFTLDLNGLQCGPSSNEKYSERLSYEDRDDSSKLRYHLHKMSLNGAEPILSVMGKILMNKGELKLTLSGKDVRIVSATLTAHWTDSKDCSNPPPPPPPPPPPVAPDTAISSKSPAASPTASTSMNFEFSSDQIGVSYQCSLDGAAASACTSPAAYSNLGNGNHSFKVFATNSFGLSDASPAQYNWVVDSVAADVVITNAGALPAITNVNSISLQFAASDAVRYECALDGAAASACASPAGLFGLAEGHHSISIWGIDALSNRSANAASFEWVIDASAPIASFMQIDPAAALLNTTSKSFVFAANESASFECAIDHAGFAPCVSPLALDNLAEGEHFLEVRAIDVAGNLGNPASHAWNIDLSAPVIEFGQMSPDAGLNNARMVSVEFSANEEVAFSCSLDGAAAIACESPFVSAIADEGAHSLVVNARDAAGNAAAAIEVDWEMDFTLPLIAWGAFDPSAAMYINSSHLSAEVTASEPVSLYFDLNAASLGQLPSPLMLSGLSEGSYELGATGIDNAGNSSAAIAHEFVVDMTAPVASVSADLAALRTNRTDNRFAFVAGEEGSFECQLDASGFAPCSSPLAASGLAEGDHAFEVRAIDLAGNVSAVASVGWNVDLTAPVTSIAAQQVGSFAYSFAFASDEPASGFECALDGAAFAPCSSPVVQSNLTEGSHSFAVRASDEAGNMNPLGSSIAVLVERAIATQIISSSPSGELTNLGVMQIAFAATHAQASFECSLDGAAPSACSSPASYSGLGEGAHNFKVFAIDRFGSRDAIGAAHAWSIDMTAPIGILSANRTQNASISFDFSADEPATFTCSLDGAAFADCSSPRSLSGLAIGGHSFAVRTRDLAGNGAADAATYSWTVDPPITTAISGSLAATDSYYASASMTVWFVASLPNATFVCSWDGEPASPCTSSTSRSGLPDGAHSFQVWAIDVWGSKDPVGSRFTWFSDTVGPGVTSISTTQTSTSITINWQTNEPATSAVNWGTGTSTNRVVAEDSVYSTSHSVKLTGLLPNTVYSYIVSGHDRAGNAYSTSRRTARTNP